MKSNAEITIKSVDTKKHIVTGVVYAPFVLDSQGDFMSAEDIEKMAHKFMADSVTKNIDVMHDNVVIKAYAVESYINKDNPDFPEGAWVVSVKVEDPVVWDKIEKGEYNGFSMEVLAKGVPVSVEYEVQQNIWGYTEKQEDGHYHAYYLTVNETGKPVSGRTSVDNGHYHLINKGTATEMAEGHAHRVFIN